MNSAAIAEERGAKTVLDRNCALCFVRAPVSREAQSWTDMSVQAARDFRRSFHTVGHRPLGFRTASGMARKMLPSSGGAMRVQFLSSSLSIVRFGGRQFYIVRLTQVR